ncbi:unnamed protein product [Arabidopsis halleri]
MGETEKRWKKQSLWLAFLTFFTRKCDSFVYTLATIATSSFPYGITPLW